MNIRRAEVVGPKVSRELLRDGMMAMVLAVVHDRDLRRRALRMAVWHRGAVRHRP